MKLSYRDVNNIIRELPKIKLSYVKNVHKKVYTADIYLVIPKGIKYFSWFRYYKNKPVCLFLEINKGNTIKNINCHTCCFNRHLCSGKGTLFYGTFFKCNNANFYSIEDIFYLKGSFIGNKTLISKLNIINTIFQEDIKQIILSNKNIVIGLPVMSNSRHHIDSIISNLPYNIYCIQHRFFHNNNTTFYNERIISKNAIIKTFLVKPDVNCDIYLLYYNNSSKLEFYNYALIPDYKTSIKMNSIFRNIKENTNIDFIEESESEDDFENISENKYLKKTDEKMDCVYNLKHNLWVPVNISKNLISNRDDIIRIEKNNR